MVEGFWIWVAAAVVGYLLGSLPTAYLLVRFFTRKNVMDWGTGNVGTMNVHRATSSKVLTLLTLLGDLTKAYAAIMIGWLLARQAGLDSGAAPWPWAVGGDHIGATVAGVAAILGHNYSIFLRFKGGKGITCAASMGFYFPSLHRGLLGAQLLPDSGGQPLAGAGSNGGHGDHARLLLLLVPPSGHRQLLSLLPWCYGAMPLASKPSSTAPNPSFTIRRNSHPRLPSSSPVLVAYSRVFSRKPSYLFD